MNMQALLAAGQFVSLDDREDQAVMASLELQMCVCTVEVGATTTSLPATSRSTLREIN
jgi:hypothetical protein